MDIKTLIENETGCHFNKNNFTCCMFHSEKTPSLSVNVKRGIWKCFGCGKGGDAIQFLREYKNYSYIQACNELGLEIDETYKIALEQEEKIKDYIKWQLNNLDAYKDFKLINLYKFTDAENSIKYFKAKFQTPKKKELRYYSLVNGKVKVKREGPEVPYNFYNCVKTLERNRPIFVVEGEKDVDALNYIGKVATSLKNIKQIDLEVFKDATVYFIGDTGKAGEEYKESVFYLLKEYIMAFKVVDLPGLKELGDNKDISDWFEAGHTKEEFNLALKDTWDWKKNRYYKYVENKEGFPPKKVWENLELLLNRNKIKVKYNLLSKEVEYSGLNNSNMGSNAQFEDIFSLCQIQEFKMTRDNLMAAINRIAKKNCYNPVKEYLTKCLDSWDGKRKHINKLAETIVTKIDFPEDIKKLFLTKWLLNCANIAFNNGDRGTEGILVIQGGQGIGKTRWINTIVPNKSWVKTGLELDPSDKDKIHQATKYWITELGELDATMKKDQAKLKAFFTEKQDEYRRPYERFTEQHNRLTCFYATVNKEEFLKDETGNRRYWVIPVQEMFVEHDVDINQLWGEVMYLLKTGEIPYYLTEDDKEILQKNNEQFEVKTEAYLKLEAGFDWSETDKDKWQRLTSTQICKELDIAGYSTLKVTMDKLGIRQRKSGSMRFYELPPFSVEILQDKNNNEWKRWG